MENKYTFKRALSLFDVNESASGRSLTPDELVELLSEKTTTVQSIFKRFESKFIYSNLTFSLVTKCMRKSKSRSFRLAAQIDVYLLSTIHPPPDVPDWIEEGEVSDADMDDEREENVAFRRVKARLH